MVSSFESVSSWNQPVPEPASQQRALLIDSLAAEISAVSPARLRIAIDGLTAAGKTSFGHELALGLRRLGRSTLRASFDNFKKPWRDAREKGYDRMSGDGYYRNAPDFESARSLLLEPAGARGSGLVVLCAHDPLTGADYRATTVQAPPDAVLVVDSVFAFRPEYNEFWDCRIWLHIDPDLALERGIERDAETEGRVEAERLHRDRYHVAEMIYIAEVDPMALADVVIDNTNFARPQITRRLDG
jgi:uridine kinase